MVVCPIAIAVGCRKCPAFSVCPLKGVIGDYKPEAAPPARAAAPAQAAAPVTKSPRVKARSKRARTRRARKR